MIIRVCACVSYVCVFVCVHVYAQECALMDGCIRVEVRERKSWREKENSVCWVLPVRAHCICLCMYIRAHYICAYQNSFFM